MSTASVIAVLLIGLMIGVISGMIGIGGGVLIIPVLMFGFGFSQSRANGTSMAMLLPPIGIFAVLTYSRAGNIDWRFAALLASGFAVGAFFGAKVVNLGWINPTALRVLFALLLAYIAARLLFQPHGRARAALETSILVSVFALTYLLMRLLGRRWKRQAPDWASVYRKKLKDPVEYDYEI
jgi:uncharacterized membrane protein YfcA